MYEYFAFVDESTAKRYRLCLVAIPRHSVIAITNELKKLRLRGQRQIHMAKESDRRRKQILDVLLKNPTWRAVILQSTPDSREDNDTRQKLFYLAATQPFWHEIRHLVVERSTHNARDARTLAWIRKNVSNRFEYEFANPKDESGLWAADIIAWSYAKGGKWRSLIMPRIAVLTAP